MAMKRAKMDIETRAKQFMPFDALTGLRVAIEAKEKVVVPKMELSEDYAEELDRKMHQIEKNQIATVVYFCKDEYLKVTGMVSRLDATARILKIVNTKIDFDDILDVSIDGIL